MRVRGRGAWGAEVSGRGAVWYVDGGPARLARAATMTWAAVVAALRAAATAEPPGPLPVARRLARRLW